MLLTQSCLHHNSILPQMEDANQDLPHGTVPAQADFDAPGVSGVKKVALAHRLDEALEGVGGPGQCRT